MLRLVISFLLLSLGLGAAANAAVVITVVENGSSVVFSSDGGRLDLNGLYYDSNASIAGGVNSAWPALAIGSHGGALESVDIYGGVNGPANIGSGNGMFNKPFLSSGEVYGVNRELGAEYGGLALVLPAGYQSNGLLGASSITFLSESFSSLGIDVGIYSFTWAGDSLTVNVVPIPAAFWLFGSALIGLGWIRRKQTV